MVRLNVGRKVFFDEKIGALVGVNDSNAVKFIVKVWVGSNESSGVGAIVGPNIKSEGLIVGD